MLEMKVQDKADDSENADIAAVQETADIQPWQLSEGDPDTVKKEVLIKRMKMP